jgi:hypothetical protein
MTHARRLIFTPVAGLLAVMGLFSGGSVAWGATSHGFKAGFNGSSSPLKTWLRALLMATIMILSGLAVFAGSALAALETPVAKPATSVTGDSAVLHGELNPGAPGEPGEYQFLYEVSGGVQ